MRERRKELRTHQEVAPDAVLRQVNDEELMNHIVATERKLAALRAARAAGSDDRAEVARLELLIRISEKRLAKSESPRKRQPMSGLTATKLHIGFVGGLLFAMGLLMTTLALRSPELGLTVAGVAMAPGFLGLLLLGRALTAKTIDDFDLGGL